MPADLNYTQKDSKVMLSPVKRLDREKAEAFYMTVYIELQEATRAFFLEKLPPSSLARIFNEKMKLLSEARMGLEKTGSRLLQDIEKQRLRSSCGFPSIQREYKS